MCTGILSNCRLPWLPELLMTLNCCSQEMIIYLKDRHGINHSVEGQGLTFEAIRQMADLPEQKYRLYLTTNIWDLKKHLMREIIIECQNSLDAAIHLHHSFSSIADEQMIIHATSKRKKRSITTAVSLL